PRPPSWNRTLAGSRDDDNIGGGSTHARRELLMTWTRPAHTCDISLSGFTVTCSPSGGATVPGAATSAVVSGLVNGTVHSCRVVATNVAGSSSPSLPASAAPDGPPGPPQGFTATSGGGATWNLSWIP